MEKQKWLKLIGVLAVFIALALSSCPNPTTPEPTPEPTPTPKPPAHAAAAVSFADTDADTGEVGGTVTITKSADESDITHYVLYWGTAAATINGAAITEIAKTGGNLIHAIPADTALSGNTHFIVRTKNSVGEMSSGVSCAIVDTKSLADWTILVYMDGDNDLEPFAIQDLNELESVDLSAAKIHVLVLMDRISGYDTSNGNWTNTRLYKVKYDSAGLNSTILSQRVPSSELGLTTTGNEELNMGDPATVVNFVSCAKTNYPATNYALIFWNHGDGWRSAAGTYGSGSSAPPKRGGQARFPSSPPRTAGRGGESWVQNQLEYPALENSADSTSKAVCFDDTSLITLKYARHWRLKAWM